MVRVMNMTSKTVFILWFLVMSIVALTVNANEAEPGAKENQEISQPLYSPFIERYILDELRLLRQDQQSMKAELTEKVANARLDASDRAIRYTADTTNNIFYIITAAASILVLLGWKSIRDIKESIETTITRRVDELTLEYEDRLDTLESTIKERSNQIVATQKKISDSNSIHSLWMRAGLEKSETEKINIYDQILEISPQDVEALTYKADTLLDMDQDSWALSLANLAIESDKEYALAYWQRACAKAKLEQYDEAIEDIKISLLLRGSLKEELMSESYFDNLKERSEFQALAQGS